MSSQAQLMLRIQVRNIAEKLGSATHATNEAFFELGRLNGMLDSMRQESGGVHPIDEDGADSGGSEPEEAPSPPPSPPSPPHPWPKHRKGYTGKKGSKGSSVGGKCKKNMKH
jgi:hypothetical protein